MVTQDLVCLSFVRFLKSFRGFKLLARQLLCWHFFLEGLSVLPPLPQIPNFPSKLRVGENRNPNTNPNQNENNSTGGSNTLDKLNEQPSFCFLTEIVYCSAAGAMQMLYKIQ